MINVCKVSIILAQKSRKRGWVSLKHSVMKKMQQAERNFSLSLYLLQHIDAHLTLHTLKFCLFRLDYVSFTGQQRLGGAAILLLICKSRESG